MGKRIEDLPDYGSYDLDKMLSDILEISKNSGTSVSPVYASDGSRQIKLSQLAALVGLAIPGGYIPLIGPNYLVVTLGTNVASGTNLLAAIAYAKAATPNGSALSASNRFTVLLFPGIYDIGVGIIANLGEFVDIIGVGDQKDIIIKSTNGTGVIKIADTNNYILKNLTIKNTGAGGSIVHNVAQTDNGIWDNLTLTAATTDATTFAGSYSYVTATVASVLNGGISGLVYRCSFTSNSCGYTHSGTIVISGVISECKATGNSCFGSTVLGDVTISGTIERCTSLNKCFGYGGSNGAPCTVTITGLITDCTGTDECFAAAFDECILTFSGIIQRCNGNDRCFGSSYYSHLTFTGKIDSCKGNDRCFGYSTLYEFDMNGIILNCIANDLSFIAAIHGPFGTPASVDLSGSIKNCIGNEMCFGYSEDSAVNIGGVIQDCNAANKAFGSSTDGNVSTSGKIINCKNGDNGFGYSENGTVTNSALILGCTGEDNCFGSTTVDGKLIDCIRSNGYGEHLGLVSDCIFTENHATNPTITIGDGAVLTRSRFTQAGAGDCVFGVAIEAEMSYCYMNKPLSGVSNSLDMGFNIGDIIVSSSFVLYSPNGHRQKITVNNTSAIETEDLDP